MLFPCADLHPAFVVSYLHTDSRNGPPPLNPDGQHVHAIISNKRVNINVSVLFDGISAPPKSDGISISISMIGKIRQQSE